MRVALLLALALLATGCATTNRGTSDFFRIDTVPQGATVTLSLERRQSDGTMAPVACPATPCAIRVPRRSEFIATIEKDGYEPFEMYVGYSSKRIAYGGSVGANVVGSAGAGFLGGMLTSSIAIAITDVTLTALTLGTVSASGSSAAASSVAVSGSIVGAGIGVGMVAIDGVSGAYQFTAPSPVVLELVLEGTPVLSDPAIVVFREKQRIEGVARKKCTPLGRRSAREESRCLRETRKELWEASTIPQEVEAMLPQAQTGEK
ncbi:MAG: hypothetical protein AAF830_06780 [Pseudomonadota bacterium]